MLDKGHEVESLLFAGLNCGKIAAFLDVNHREVHLANDAVEAHDLHPRCGCVRTHLGQDFVPNKLVVLLSEEVEVVDRGSFGDVMRHDVALGVDIVGDGLVRVRPNKGPVRVVDKHVVLRVHDECRV